MTFNMVVLEIWFVLNIVDPSQKPFHFTDPDFIKSFVNFISNT